MLIRSVLLTILVILIIVLLLVLWRQSKKIKDRQEAYQEQEKYLMRQSEAVREEQEQLEQYKKEIRDMIAVWKLEHARDQSAPSSVFAECQEVLLQDMKAGKRAVVYWKNPVLNMVFLQKLEECDACDIKVSLKGFPKEGISILEKSMSEMIGLFSNLMDNAIEACMHLQEEARWIRIQVNYEKKRIFFVIENSFGAISKREHGKKTWKKDKQEHGIGKDIIHEIIDRNQGWITYEEKDGVHRVELMLPAEDEKGFL